MPSYNAVQINLQKPTVNAPQPSLYDYPISDGQLYYPPLSTTVNSDNRIKRSPSGIDDYDNYQEVDKYGNVIADIQYSKDKDALVQKITTKSPDGTILKKTLKNPANFKSSNIVITDKNGKILLSKDKTYEKIDENNAKTVINGETYNISGLKGDVIKVEHNGEEIQLDLNKMLKTDVKLLQLCISPDNYPIRDNNITDEEKEKLFNRIKSLGGDDLFRLSKSVEHLQFLDEKSHEAFFVEHGKTLLLSPKDWENSHMVAEHELGHAINHTFTHTLLSENDSFKNIRNYEKLNFKQSGNMTNGDKLFSSKFLDGNPDLAWSDAKTNGDEIDECNLRDETFAECYNNLNTMDIIHYDEEVLPMRTLSLFKYMPRTMAITEQLSQI